MVFINTQTLYIGALVVLLILGANALAFVVSVRVDDSLAVHFIDVGQGDGVLIETPDNRRILIDGGARTSNIAFKVGDMLPFYDKRIDVVISTHADSDHIGGLIDVLDRFEVGAVIVGDTTNQKFLNKTFIQKAQQNGVVVHEAGNIQRIRIGEVVFEFLHLDFQKQSNATENQKSVIVKVVYKNDSFLFTGDIDDDVELNLINERVDVSADVLKVSHHGSKSSSVSLFLEAVNPRIAVIQVGADNSYGHPHPDALQRLKYRTPLILRNDQHGTISLYSTGNSF